MMIAIFAVAFAFGALTAIRWPSIIMVVGFLQEDGAGEALAGVDWRQLGLVYGAPYFLAALCLYASAAMAAQHRHGAFTWYVMGCVAGFPCVYLVDFHEGWWTDPTAGEGAVAGAGVIAVLLAVAVWDLRKRKPGGKPKRTPAASGEEMVMVPASMLVQAPPTGPKPVKPAPRAPRSAAIMHQRASFAREGRKMRERQERRRGRS